MASRLDEVLDEQSDDDVEIRGVADERDPDEEGEMEDGDDEDKVKEKEGGAASKDDKTAEPTKKRRPRFTEDHLCGERGLQKAYETFPKMCKYRGEGHEAEFLNRLLRCYMEWSHSLFPYMQFEEMVDRLQSMGGKAKVRRKLEELRGIQREAYLKQRYGQDYEKDLEEYRKAKLREEAKEEEEATRRREELYGASRRRNTETRRPDGEPEIEDLGAEVEVTREKKKEGKELFASDEEDSEGPQRSGGGGNGADGSDMEEPADEDQEEEPVKAKRGRGKGKSKGRAQKQRKDAKPKGRGRRRKKNVLSDSDRDNDEKEMASAAGDSDEHEKPKRKKLRTAGPTRRSKAKSKRNRSEDEEDADQADDESDSGKGSSPKPGSSADDDDDDNDDPVMTSRVTAFLRGLRAQGQHKVLSAKAIANRAIHDCDLHDRDPKTVKAAIVAIYTELTHGEDSPEKEPQGGRSVDKAPSKVMEEKSCSGDEQARGPMRKKPRTRRVKRHAASDDDDDDDLDVEWEDSTRKPTAMDVQEMGAAKMESEEDNREKEGPDVTLMMDDGEETVPQNPQVGESSGHDAEDDGATESVSEHAAGREGEPRQTDLELDETIHMDQEPETVAQEAVDLDESEARAAAGAGSILDSVAADGHSGAADDEARVPTRMETEDAKEGSVAPVDDEDRMASQDF